jgi:hypothetical protein
MSTKIFIIQILRCSVMVLEQIRRLQSRRQSNWKGSPCLNVSYIRKFFFCTGSVYTLSALLTLPTTTPSFKRMDSCQLACNVKYTYQRRCLPSPLPTEGCVDQRQTPRLNEFTACRRYSLRGDADAYRLRYQRRVVLINDEPLVRMSSLRVDDTCGMVT